MGQLVSLLTANHASTKRDYAARAGEDKPNNSMIAKKFDFDYWDGDRNTGYGGYKDDGRWKNIASRFLNHYSLPECGSVLDIGCGKGFFLKELKNSRTDLAIRGVDISEYAISNASPEVREFLTVGQAEALPHKAGSFDLVVSMNTLHNLQLPDLFETLKKIESIQKKYSYICVESYRNEMEKWNLMRWQLTCECFFTPKEWTWIFEKAGYTGDFEFIFFE